MKKKKYLLGIWMNKTYDVHMCVYSSVGHSTILCSDSFRVCSVVMDPSSRGCGVVTSTYSLVGLVLSVCIVDLYNSWDLFVISRDCLVGGGWTLTFVREGDVLGNWPVCVWMKDDQERKLWEITTPVRKHQFQN